MNILVVEDDTITCRRLMHFLEKWGHHVISAANGLEAIEQFLSHRIDIVLTDWMMPEMDGLQLIEHIRRHAVNIPYVYIIMLTARGQIDDVVRALSIGGADDYMVKPFDPEELRARIIVGERTVVLERTLNRYNRDLEKIVQHRTSAMRRMHEEVLTRLLTAIHARSGKDSHHIQRMMELVEGLAAAAGWSDERIRDIRLAAALHDIGEIGIPDERLQANAPSQSPPPATSPATHTMLGADILDGSSHPMIQMAHDIARCHHERWDGSGYPDGLQAEAIPESARMAAIVDAFGDLCRAHGVPHPAAVIPPAIMDAMQEERGGRFDPYLLELFVDMITALPATDARPGGTPEKR